MNHSSMEQNWTYELQKLEATGIVHILVQQPMLLEELPKITDMHQKPNFIKPWWRLISDCRYIFYLELFCFHNQHYSSSYIN